MEEILIEMSNDLIIKILIITLIFDIFLGSLRAIKEGKWNSTIGINGILRKVGMIGSILFLFLTDRIIHFDLLFMIPKEILAYVGITTAGSCELFGIMFILYEATSVLKNMVLCEIPCPKGLEKKMKKMLENMTSELDGKGENNGR